MWYGYDRYERQESVGKGIVMDLYLLFLAFGSNWKQFYLSTTQFDSISSICLEWRYVPYAIYTSYVVTCIILCVQFSVYCLYIYYDWCICTLFHFYRTSFLVNGSKWAAKNSLLDVTPIFLLLTPNCSSVIVIGNDSRYPGTWIVMFGWKNID